LQLASKILLEFDFSSSWLLEYGRKIEIDALICWHFEPYYKSKLELKSNSSEILSANCNFICVHIFFFCAESQTRIWVLSV